MDSAQVKTASRWDFEADLEGSEDLNKKTVRTRWDASPSRAGFTSSKLELDGSSRWPLLESTKEDYERNRFLTDSEISDMLPKEGYTTIPVPLNYISISSYRKTEYERDIGKLAYPSQADFLNQDDFLLEQASLPRDIQDMTIAEARQQKLLKLLLAVKKGPNTARNQAIKQITNKVLEFGVSNVIEYLLSLLLKPSVDFLERHYLIKLLNRLILKCGTECGPYVQKISNVVSPLLVDPDFHIRIEGRETISNLAKATGISVMIASLKPALNDQNDILRNAAARCFAIIASALGIPTIVPFLKAACQSKDDVIRHTSIKIIQQIAVLFGSGVLPYLRTLLGCFLDSLEDSNTKIRNIAALAISALAESSYPHGIESFSAVVDPLWRHSHKLRGKSLATFVKAMGALIALMPVQQAVPYAKDMLSLLLKLFQSHENEERRIALQTLDRTVQLGAFGKKELREEIFPNVMKAFLTKHFLSDRRGVGILCSLIVRISPKVGIDNVILRFLPCFTSDAEALRRFAAEITCRIFQKYGTSEVTSSENQLFNGLLFTFQEHSGEDALSDVIRWIGSSIKLFGVRVRPYLGQIFSLIFWRLTHKSPKVRQFATELAQYLLECLEQLREKELIEKLAIVLYENLGEEYPEVLASILSTINGIFNLKVTKISRPSNKELLYRLNPILRSRNERVQEGSVVLIGTLAKADINAISAKEWMRICFELLELLKSPRKIVRRAAILTFGLVAKAIGPHDVMAALLNNLRVQERTSRVATTLAIAIVAESCAPFTVLPSLINEYRVPEMNVQNGVLKSIAFMCEFIGDLSKDYIYSLVTLLDDALQDRDQVHRQSSAIAFKHLSLAVMGYGCEDALVHLMNALIPNLFDANTHLILAVMEAIDSARLSISGACVMLYIIQGIFHPARRVRTVFWKLYNNLYIGSGDALVFSIPYSNHSKEPKRCPVLDLAL